jgi:transcriptional regulator with XRE-family HTH domain
VSSALKRFKAQVLKRPEVRKEYEGLADEFAFVDELLKARASAGLTQAQLAERIGTTQSAVARLESGSAAHSPSIATLQRYASALGFRVEVRFVKLEKRSGGSTRGARVGRHSGTGVG